MEAVHAAGAGGIYVGISYAYDLPGKQRMCIDNLYEVARNLFDEYVKPLQQIDVTLRNGDEQHIHFDDRTVDRVLQAIVKALSRIKSHSRSGRGTGKEFPFVIAR